MSRENREKVGTESPMLKVLIPVHPSTTWCQKQELTEIMLFPIFSKKKQCLHVK